MKIFEITEAKVEMCPEACCGKPVTECKCGPDCEHCDCHAKNKMNEDEDLGNVIKTGVKGSYDVVAKAIKDYEELIRNNPNHPKVPQVKAELAKLKPMLAKAQSEMSEDATAGATSAGAMATIANPPSANAKIKRKNGVPIAPQKKNKDGTAKNALELGNNLMGGGTVKR
jgi:hypothetical protein